MVRDDASCFRRRRPRRDALPAAATRAAGVADLTGPGDSATTTTTRAERRLGPAPRRVIATITVPFPPESPASGIGETGYHPVVWYSRALTVDDLRDAGLGADAPRVLLHFGAVDYRAKRLARRRAARQHEGGHTPFSFDVTDARRRGRPPSARWSSGPRTTRTTSAASRQAGLAARPARRSGTTARPASGSRSGSRPCRAPRHPDARLDRDLPAAAVDLALELRGPVTASAVVEVVVAHDGAELGRVDVPAASRTITTRVHLVAQRTGRPTSDCCGRRSAGPARRAGAARRSGGRGARSRGLLPGAPSRRRLDGAPSGSTTGRTTSAACSSRGTGRSPTWPLPRRGPSVTRSS